jgi:hypothetical protein
VESTTDPGSKVTVTVEPGASPRGLIDTDEPATAWPGCMDVDIAINRTGEDPSVRTSRFVGANCAGAWPAVVSGGAVCNGAVVDTPAGGEVVVVDATVVDVGDAATGADECPDADGGAVVAVGAAAVGVAGAAEATFVTVVVDVEVVVGVVVVEVDVVVVTGACTWNDMVWVWAATHTALPGCVAVRVHVPAASSDTAAPEDVGAAVQMPAVSPHVSGSPDVDDATTFAVPPAVAFGACVMETVWFFLNPITRLVMP